MSARIFTPEDATAIQFIGKKTLSGKLSQSGNWDNKALHKLKSRNCGFFYKATIDYNHAP